MKILIVGLGSIARRHIRNLKVVYPSIQIAVLRQHSKDTDLGDLQDLVDNIFFKEKDALKWNPAAVFVTNPAPFHVSTALVFAQQGSHLFIEKPLSDKLNGIDHLINECEKKNLVLMVGYCLRFLEPLKLIKKAIEEGRIGRVLSIHATVGRYLPDWRPRTDYRQNVTAKKELGGGILLELSHEIDYVRWLLGEIKQVGAFVETLSDFDIDVEDIAEINFKFKTGALGHIHMDMVDRASNRSCRIVGTIGTLVWDYQDKHLVEIYSAKDNKWSTLWHRTDYDYNQMYIDQFKHFFECIQNKQNPLIDGVQAKRVVELVCAIKRSAKKGEVIKV